MKQRYVSLPTIGLIAGTRAALGLGIGLLIAGRISAEKRSAVGWTLVAVGALTTIPLIAQVLPGTRACRGEDSFKRPIPESLTF